MSTTDLIGRRILFLGAHADDIEIGCGGTAAKYAAAGRAIAFAQAADCGRDRRQESRNAAALLDLDVEHGTLFFGNIPDGRLEERKDVLRNWLTDVAERFQPDTVIVHRRDDTHPDHVALHEAVIRALVHPTLLVYPIPKLASQSTPFDPNYWEDVSGFFETKLQLCACHVSQAGKGIYLDPEHLRSLARVAFQSGFGRTGGFAESFRIQVARSAAAVDPGGKASGKTQAVPRGGPPAAPKAGDRILAANPTPPLEAARFGGVTMNIGKVEGTVIGTQVVSGDQLMVFSGSSEAGNRQRPRPESPRGSPDSMAPGPMADASGSSIPPTRPPAAKPPSPSASWAPAQAPLEAGPSPKGPVTHPSPAPGDCLAALQRTLIRLGLIGAEAAMPAPFKTLAGESEGATTYFCMVPTRVQPAGELFAAKCVHSASDRSALWSQIEQYRQNKAHPALLPAEGNAPADGVLVFRDGDWAARVLGDLGILPAAAPLPQPLRVLSGIGGFSRLYLFHVGGQTVLVKFDRPDRQAAEWASIGRLRSLGNLPPEVLLPFPRNAATDGAIVFPAFQGRTVYGDVWQLNELLIERLLTRYEHPQQAAERMFSALERLYQGGRDVPSARTWHSSHPELSGRTEQIAPLLAGSGVALPTDEETWEAAGLLGQPLATANPLSRMTHRLGQLAGTLFLSRVHGDLQSTNVLVSLGRLGAPESLAIIDLEKFADDQPVVDDLVRIEADFWRSVFTEIARRHLVRFAPPVVRKLAAEAFVLALDALDGRSPRVRPSEPEVSALAHAAGRWVFELRQRSWRIILPKGEASHWPRDWFHGLLFYDLKALLRPLVNQDPLRLRIVLLGAALAEETLRDMDAGRYDGGGLQFPDQWPPNGGPGPAVLNSPPVAPQGGMEHGGTVEKGFIAGSVKIEGGLHIH